MFITDDHMHLQDEPVRSARKFQDAGGTHLFLCHLPYKDLPSWEYGYKKQYERTIKTAELVRRETLLKVFVVAGPYPVISSGFMRQKVPVRHKNMVGRASDLRWNL